MKPLRWHAAALEPAHRTVLKASAVDRGRVAIEARFEDMQDAAHDVDPLERSIDIVIDLNRLVDVNERVAFHPHVKVNAGSRLSYSSSHRSSICPCLRPRKRLERQLRARLRRLLELPSATVVLHRPAHLRRKRCLPRRCRALRLIPARHHSGPCHPRCGEEAAIGQHAVVTNLECGIRTGPLGHLDGTEVQGGHAPGEQGPDLHVRDEPEFAR